ncbi:MAG: hypothetical protein QOJ40_2660 [Verrucomicrobiota bacterium]
MKTKANYSCGTALLAGLLLVAQSGAAAAKYEQNLEKSFSTTPGGKLVVQVQRGSIEVRPDGGGKTEVHVFRQVKRGSKEEADRLFAAHEVAFQQDGNTISVIEKSKKDRSWWRGIRQPNLEVRYQISIPIKYDVDLETSGGDIRLHDLDGNASMRTSSGSINAGKITGTVEARNSGGDIIIQEAGGRAVTQTSSGSIAVTKANGKLEASNSGGDIHVEDAGEDAVLRTSSGSITITAARGSVDARNSGGDIKIGSAAGKVAVETSSGSIHLGAIKAESVSAKNSGGSIDIVEAEGSVFAQTSSGGINIKAARGKVEAKDSGGDIVIGEAGSEVAAQTSSGSIRIKSAKGQIEVSNSGGNISVGDAGAGTIVRTSSGSIHVGLAKGKLEARNSGGDIVVGDARDIVIADTSSGTIAVNFSTAPKAESRLSVSGGDIKASLPEFAAVNVDARSSGGEVRTELSSPMTEREQKQGLLRGKLNGGGPSLVLRSSSGDIRLNKSAVAMVTPEAEESGRPKQR